MQSWPNASIVSHLEKENSSQGGKTKSTINSA